MAARPTTLAALLAAAALISGGCGGGDSPTSGTTPAPDEASAAPPTPEADDLGRVALTLTGGPFGEEGREISYPVRDEPGNRWAPVPGGFRLMIHDPSGAGIEPVWGLWLFLRGEIDLDNRLVAETGSQVVIDGVPYAPVEADEPPTADSPALDARLVVEFLDRREGTFDAVVEATVMPPDGSAVVRVRGLATLPMPAEVR